jgi:hypothetical protein
MIISRVSFLCKNLVFRASRGEVFWARVSKVFFSEDSFGNTMKLLKIFRVVEKVCDALNKTESSYFLLSFLKFFGELWGYDDWQTNELVEIRGETLLNIQEEMNFKRGRFSGNGFLWILIDKFTREGEERKRKILQTDYKKHLTLGSWNCHQVSPCQLSSQPCFFGKKFF